MLNSIEMLRLDANTAFPVVHTGDEVVLLTYPHYTTATVQSVEFMSPPLQDGFLHIMTIIDPSSKPFAMFLVYNLPSVGYNRLPIPDTLQGLSGRASYVDNSTTVIRQDSYRSQYVVLVYRTNNPVLISQNQIFAGQGPDLMAGCTDVRCMVTNSVLGRELGQPLAGSIFHITTKQTLFQTVEIISDNLTQAASNVAGHLLIVFVASQFL
ncbi:unnamed protein product [Cylicostephanus goldi]|uniref:Uncharacterized protein n=1 Tax=Cylicostephanus goldi TaxID=71465 RepID=A0A3P7N3U5_CYLGO|nr:unnamed protein product [Cylicostephanus goldi]